MSELTATKTDTFELPKEGTIVYVRPVKRKRGNIKDENHAAAHLFENSYLSIGVPNDKSGNLKDPLTREEKEYFEDRSRSGLPFEKGSLSIYNKHEDNFWVGEASQIKLRREGDKLDLGNPMDYIKYKILLSNTDIIAPSPEEAFNKATYKFAIQEADYQDKVKVKEYHNKKEIYKFLGKIETDKTQMINFLMVFDPKKHVSENSKMSFLISELERLSESQTDKFVEIMKDNDRDYKATIYRAIKLNALQKEGTNYLLPEGDNIGSNLKEAIEFLKDPKNQEIYDKIIARIEV